MALPVSQLYWIVNLVDPPDRGLHRSDPDGYTQRVDYGPGEFIPLVIDSETVGQIPVDDILP